MVPLCILGLIGRYGPQHGYQIRKMIQEQGDPIRLFDLAGRLYTVPELQEIAGRLRLQGVQVRRSSSG